MQWDTLITSIGGASAVLGVVGYVLKRSFERVLDAKLKESEERHKVLLAETVRRQAALYDQQFGALKTILALIYRARNAARGIHQSDGKPDREVFRRLHFYHSSMEEMLFEQRAILPEDVFDVAHRTKHQVHELLAHVEHLRRRPDAAPKYTEYLREMYEALDTSYQHLVSAVQAHIKPDDDTA